MKFLEFKEAFYHFGLFSIKDIQKLIPGFYFKNLNYWNNKGYLVKLKNGWYCFPEFLRRPKANWLIANTIYQPSYISLESALSFYGVIPEAVFSTTCVSTKRTMSIQSDAGNFYYYTEKPALYFGYKLIPFDTKGHDQISTRQIRLADLEKAILDFLYLRKQYNTEQDIIDLRFDAHILQNELNWGDLFESLEQFENKALETRVKKLVEVYR
ncbi:hypothetical protein GF406_05430 [candidate division KSB1 bacterium]|nr:hypothetical protein [candidate division KSB1 bacterium]